MPPIAEFEDSLVGRLKSMRAQDLVRRGMSEADARQKALSEFGDAQRLKKSLGRMDRSAQRDRRLTRWFADCAYDVRFALRQIWRSPLFATVSILTVAIGIGATTAGAVYIA